MNRRLSPLSTLGVVVVTVAACGPRQVPISDGVQADHEEGRVSIVGTDSNGDAVRGSTPILAADECMLFGDTCLTPEAAGEFCEREGGPYDVIVVDGEVVEVVCYPPGAGDDADIVVGGDGDIDVPQNANNTTIVFDDDTDGEAIEGDLVIDGNNVAVYGNGPTETILRGNVVLDGNNVRLRGLTIEGDLTLAKNNLAVLFVNVTGTVTITGNNSVFAGSSVFGDLDITGNNTILVQNAVQGTLSSPGKTEVCADNRAFADVDDDGLIDAGEIGALLACE